MDNWINMMSMMSPTADEITPVSLIKKEESFQSCSPSDVATTTLYSPSTTVLPAEMKFCDSNFVEITEHIPKTSPGSPDHQYCSSTTQSLGDSMFSHVEEGIKQDDLPRRLCLVCGDIASGFHYGVASCEACKAFFKRTIQGNIEYTCPAANDCEINKRRRKACQACRFQKCLHMGMLKEGVRLDRVRGGRQKYRRNPDMTQSMQNWPSMIKSSPSLEDNKMLGALNICEPDMLNINADVVPADPGLRIIGILSDLYDRELVHIIGWAKQIPGFTDLSLNDQMRLLQSTWAEILTLTMAYRSLPHGNGKLHYATDFALDERQARECGAIEIHNLSIHVIDKLSKLSIAKEEYLLLKALVLANSDVRLEDPSALKKFRDTILSSLGDCVFIIRPNTCISHIQNLLLCLPSLRQADQVIRRFWYGISREGKVVMNKLFIEMLESGSSR